MQRNDRLITVGLILLLATAASAETSASKHLHHPDAWYRTEEARRIADVILSYQSPRGDWPKNTDTTTQPYAGKPDDLHGTFDNSATTPELRYLARMITASRGTTTAPSASPADDRYTAAFIKGLDHILAAQYANGGWPQSSPPPARGYYRYITFNDDAMANLMHFIRDVADDGQRFGFVDADRREKCAAAWDKGVQCILDCQVKVDGKLTAWCAQHDEQTLEPRPARAYEKISLSGAESVELVRILMSVKHPSARMVDAINAACAWFDAVKITGIKIEDRPQPGSPHGFDRIVMEDRSGSAEPQWARFYEIGTSKPIFCDRDGVVKYSLADIGLERRTGYRWYGTWPKDLLARDYPAWKTTTAPAIDRP